MINEENEYLYNDTAYKKDLKSNFKIYNQLKDDHIFKVMKFIFFYLLLHFVLYITYNILNPFSPSCRCNCHKVITPIITEVPLYFTYYKYAYFILAITPLIYAIKYFDTKKLTDIINIIKVYSPEIQNEINYHYKYLSEQLLFYKKSHKLRIYKNSIKRAEKSLNDAPKNPADWKINNILNIYYQSEDLKKKIIKFEKNKHLYEKNNS